MPERKILLVDDVDFFLEVEKDFLRQTPAAILIARNGREALEVAAREKPDLIFLDVTMPVMDGLTCCRALKDDPVLRLTPVIMVFAPNAAVDEAACWRAGCDGVLTKPIDRRAFLELGHRLLFQIDRRAPRVAAQGAVTLWRGKEEFPATCEDLSGEGMYLACRQAVQADELLRAVIVLPGAGGRQIDCRVRVAWVNQGFPRSNMNLPQGFGVEFQGLGLEAAGLVAQTLRSRS